MYSPERDQLVSTYEQCWKEFYEWSEQEALRSLKQLDFDEEPFSCDETDDDVSAFRTPPEFESDSDDPTHVTQRLELGSKDISWLQTFADGANQTVSVSTSRLRCSTIAAGPRYESCDAIVRRVYLGSEEKITYPRAMPYADDPSFNRTEYLENFADDQTEAHFKGRFYVEEFEQTMLSAEYDPDYDAIELETVRRASEHLSLQEIEDMNVLSRPLQPQKDQCGLIISCWQRDMIKWPCIGDNQGILADIFHAIAKTQDTDSILLREHFSNFIDNACFRLPCIEPYCISHPPKTRIMRPSDPPLSRDGFRAASRRSCGSECFLDAMNKDIQNDILWAEDDIDSLALIISQCPTLSSCELAIVTEKPCFEVYEQRVALELRRPEIFEDRAPTPVVVKNIFMDFPLVATHPHTPFGCYHDGPCDDDENCPCFRIGQYCQSSCACGPRCGRQYPGCDCVARSHPNPHNAVCRTKRTCLCIRLGRECEPRVCGPCKADHGPTFCHNVTLGAETAASYLVAEGTYGFGLFARGAINKDVLLGDYGAEVLGIARSNTQAVISRHLDRNYLFDWCKEEDLSLDALEAGNGTRFINHQEAKKDNQQKGKKSTNQKGKTANVAPETRWVNGDVRIGIYTTRKIQKGEELFMDYGMQYFLDDSQEANDVN